MGFCPVVCLSSSLSGNRNLVAESVLAPYTKSGGCQEGCLGSLGGVLEGGCLGVV